MAVANFEQGKLYKVEPVQSGETRNGGTWYRQNIIVEIPGHNNTLRYIKLEAGGERQIQEIAALPIGSEVQVAYFVKGRWGSGKWDGQLFNDVLLVSIQPTIATAEAMSARKRARRTTCRSV